jgi:ParB family chromosome partitioning protein
MRDQILARHLSVRQTEALVASPGSPPPTAKPHPDPLLTRMQESLQAHLEAPVTLRRKGQRGTLTIAFQSEDELARILERIGVQRS